ncbi:hypothetical protein Q3G72_004781 [Acer saccharum]|nr:hypothetical protein Q3G72_004781 [Acer saccharum]
MITPKLIGALNKIKHIETASDIARVMSYSGIELLKNSPVILSTLNSHVVQLVLSNPKLPLRSCLEFFNFLRQNPFNKPDLVAHLTLIRRLYDRRKFTDLQFVLNCIANDVNLRTSVSNIVSLVEDDTDDPIFVQKLCGMLFGVYADYGMLEEAIGVFDYMEKSGFKIQSKSCMTLLLALMRCDKMDMCFSFFRRMVEANVEITVHSLNTVIHGLCKGGEVERAKDLMEEMITKGIEPNVFTYNMLINGYCIIGMVDKAFKVKAIMEQKGFKPNIITYNTIAGGLCKLKRYEEAKSWFFTMIEREITPNMTEAHKLRGVMEATGSIPNAYIYASLIHGELLSGKSTEALELFSEMKQRGLVPDDVTYTVIILGLSKQGRPGEALRLYDEMIEAGITPNERLYSSVAASISSVLKIISFHFVTISALESGPNLLASTPLLCPPPIAFSVLMHHEQAVPEVTPVQYLQQLNIFQPRCGIVDIVMFNKELLSWTKSRILDLRSICGFRYAKSYNVLSSSFVGFDFCCTSGNNRYEAWEPGPWFSEEKNSSNVDRLVQDFWTPVASLAWLIEFVW